MPDQTPSDRLWLQHPVDAGRDHVRGDLAAADAIVLVLYGDYLCPYCRRLRPVMLQLRDKLGDRFVYIFGTFSQRDGTSRRDLHRAGDRGSYVSFVTRNQSFVSIATVQQAKNPPRKNRS